MVEIASTQVVRTVDFPYSLWPVDGDRIQPKDSTWTLTPIAVVRAHGVKGILSCPSCAKAALVPPNETKLTGRGTLRLDGFQCASCKFTCNALLIGWDKKNLYCIAYEMWIDKKIVPSTEYLHAESTQDALRQFRDGHMQDPVSHIVGCSIVIGYKVLDNQGKILSV
jgi:hypothetical protein